MSPPAPDPMKSIESLSDEELTSLARRSLALPDAPAALVQAAIDLWPRAADGKVKAAVQRALARVSAMLTFDSWAAPAVALGMRSVPSDIRHLLYSAQGRDVDVRISPAAGSFAVTGQILGPDDTGSVELALAGDDQSHEPRVAALDPFGEFRLDEVSPGTYVLTLRLSSEEIVLPPINVGEGRS